MKYSYYPGCTLRTKAKDLDSYARLSAKALGFELEEIENWQCCGGVYPLGSDEIATKLSSVRVLNEAKEKGQDLVTLCSACHHVIKRVNDDMKNVPDIQMRANNYMQLETPYMGETNVLHFLEVLRDKVGFDNLKKWIQLCHKCGIKYFEMNHLFTQWGAKHAPKIMATVNGEYQRIFGWETDALSEEYSEFLHTFLTELVAFLKAEGIMGNCFFHVSDEPKKSDEEQYKREKEILLSHIRDTQIMDALSDYSFYEKGIVSTPVVACNHLQPFLEKDVQGLWAYYCMSQRKEVPNRFMAMPAYRNRILGYLLYKYDIKGFLHWGFNFWFTQLSLDVLDPYHDTSAGSGFPSGDAFIVYPLDRDGEVVCSTRLYVFNEAMQDLQALKLLEKLTDRETVMELIRDVESFAVYPRNNQYIIKVREAVNREIQLHLGNKF